MKADSHAEMHEGPDAWSRFQKAMKTIVRVPKAAVTSVGKKSRSKTKRHTKHR